MECALHSPCRAGVLVRARASTSSTRPVFQRPFSAHRYRGAHPSPSKEQEQQPLDVSRQAVDYGYPSAPELPPERMGEAARRALWRATGAVRRYGWLSFWAQLTLSVVGGVILLFSVAFTSQSGPKASLYLTLFGILAGFLSTFWNFGYTRTALKMQAYLDAAPGQEVPKVKKQQVVDMVTRGIFINMTGLAATLAGVQALVGMLVAKTLQISSYPFMAAASGGNYNPVVALDVFLVQAATNTLLGHFVSLACSLWLLHVVGEGQGLRFQRFVSLELIKQRSDDTQLPSLPSFSLEADADAGGELLKTNAGRPLQVPPRPGGDGGGGGGASGRKPTPPRPQPAFRDTVSASASSSSSVASSSSGSSISNKAGYSGFTGGVLRGSSGGSSSSSSSSGGYSGRGSGPVVAASALALSWSDESPGWKDIPAPPPPRPATAAAAAAPPPPSKPSPSSSASASLTSTSTRGAAAASTAPLSLPPGEDPDILSPAPLSFRASGVASTSGRGQPSSDAADRPLLFPTKDSLTYLDGTLPGDFGFDPLGLFDPANGSAGFMSQRWLHTAELMHGRWAMLGAAGCLAPEYLAHEKVIPKATGLLWFKTGFLPPVSAGFDYGLSLDVLFVLQMVMMGAAEGLRGAEYARPGCLRDMRLLGMERLIATTRCGSTVYPGGLMFNPLGLGDRPAAMRELQQSEIRHGRLAMLACLGYAAQAVVTGRGPYDNWVRHLDDPEANNVLALMGNVLVPPQ
ncbi:hypothetical protein PLESTB_000079100 [Pleodorina starrii]|uniref:Chlorophyll a-b binding protein, chloroplastic n=1 Tax=Pleodorina starrii TaxID=330485 RepID=A0A9W6EXC3_9CHLO|nr:hypothetical protein PLESTM_000075600 [Pleodorina starrii]GLC48284.1 hypothetical protein PLESTB_000079100 [Pleodorina starrii]GLC66570.1 hypothetical protein PLESTF_000445000 [Pleodorina starrii]